MNPDQLFNYLDGKLDPADRDRLETQLASDPQLVRQLAVAREIHRGMSGSRTNREVILPHDDPAVAERGRKLSSKIAIAMTALVAFNVVGGLAAITYLNRKPSPKNAAASAALRRQVEASLRPAAEANLPVPSLSDDIINLSADQSQLEPLATAVLAAAEACGGSAIRDSSHAGEVSITARIPADRYAEFREKVVGPAARPPENASAAPLPAGARSQKTVQVRIVAARG